MSDSPLSLKLHTNEWETSPLSNQSIFIKDGTHGTHERVDNGIPLLSAKNITGSGKIYWDSGDSMISSKEYGRIHAKYSLMQDDLLITVVGTLGRCALIKTNKTFTLQRSVGIVRLYKEQITPNFLYQFSCGDYFQHQLILRSNATAQAGVYLGELGKIEIPVPSQQEQQKIASILTSVDEVIEKTESQISKLSDLKKGMMQELLTKGIGHTEFKDSPVGRIPKGWEVKELGEVGVFSKGKGIAKKDIVSTGVPCIRYAEIYTDYDFVIKKFKSFINSDTAQNSKRLKLNDIIFAGSGETVEDIGKSVAFLDDIEAYVGGDAIILSPSIEVDGKFLSYQLNDNIRRKQLRKLGQGSSILHIYSSGLKELLVHLPPFPEQQEIASILSSIDTNIDEKQQKLQQTQSLKKSLMQDLLTGKVRVKVN